MSTRCRPIIPSGALGGQLAGGLAGHGLLSKDLAVQGVKVPILNTAILWSGPFISIAGELARNWHVMGFATNEIGPVGHSDEAVYNSLIKRALQRAEPAMGNPPNMANWAIGYDAVLLYADIMRRNGIDGNTDPKRAREIIKNEFLKLKNFSGAFKYTMRETGDGQIPTTILAADVERKVWRFMNTK